MQLFLVPYDSLYFVVGGDVCPGASTAAKGPRSQPVSLGSLCLQIHHSYPTPTSQIWVCQLEAGPQNFRQFKMTPIVTQVLQNCVYRVEVGVGEEDEEPPGLC